MSKTTTCDRAVKPAAHPALRRAIEQEMSLEVATDLSRQVCQVVAERDYLLVTHEGRRAILEDVIAVAVITVSEQGLGGGTLPREQEMPGHAPAWVDLAALATVGAYLALSCGQDGLAVDYATVALNAAPDAPCASMASLMRDIAAMNMGYDPTPAGTVDEVVANVVEHRSAAPAA